MRHARRRHVHHSDTAPTAPAYRSLVEGTEAPSTEARAGGSLATSTAARSARAHGHRTRTTSTAARSRRAHGHGQPRLHRHEHTARGARARRHARRGRHRAARSTRARRHARRGHTTAAPSTRAHRSLDTSTPPRRDGRTLDGGAAAPSTRAHGRRTIDASTRLPRHEHTTAAPGARARPLARRRRGTRTTGASTAARSTEARRLEGRERRSLDGGTTTAAPSTRAHRTLVAGTAAAAHRGTLGTSTRHSGHERGQPPHARRERGSGCGGAAPSTRARPLLGHPTRSRSRALSLDGGAARSARARRRRRERRSLDGGTTAPSSQAPRRRALDASTRPRRRSFGASTPRRLPRLGRRGTLVSGTRPRHARRGRGTRCSGAGHNDNEGAAARHPRRRHGRSDVVGVVQVLVLVQRATADGGERAVRPDHHAPAVDHVPRRPPRVPRVLEVLPVHHER